MIYRGSEPYIPQGIGKVFLGSNLIWENWKHITKVWQLSKDYENNGKNAIFKFDKPLKIVDGSFKLRTAGGSNFPIKVYFKVKGEWQLVKEATIQDTNEVHFGNKDLVVTELRIDCRESNGNVMRYPADVKLIDYYQKDYSLNWVNKTGKELIVPAKSLDHKDDWFDSEGPVLNNPVKVKQISLNCYDTNGEPNVSQQVGVRGITTNGESITIFDNVRDSQPLKNGSDTLINIKQEYQDYVFKQFIVEMRGRSDLFCYIKDCYLLEWKQKGNSDILPPEPPKPTLHSIIVNNGTSEPTQAKAGETVTITANEPPLGQTFDRWTTENLGIYFADEFSSQTTFTMIDNGVTVTANYKSTARPTYQLIVDNGTGGGSYEEGTRVTITANTLQGMKFTHWKIIEGSTPTSFNEYNATNTFDMPNHKFHIEATYENDVNPEPPSGNWTEGVGTLKVIDNKSAIINQFINFDSNRLPYPVKVEKFKYTNKTKSKTNDDAPFFAPRYVIYGLDINNETVELFDSMFDTIETLNGKEYEYTVKSSLKNEELYGFRMVVHGSSHYKDVTATINMSLTKWQEKK